MTVEHTGDGIIIEDVVDQLPRGPCAYLPRTGAIEEVIIHQTAGGTHHGLAGPRATATFHTAAPIWAVNPDGSARRDRRGKRILVAGGRGWPGIAYHLFVPYDPEVQDGRAVVYRTQLDGTVSYHTGGAANRRGIGVVLQGLFETRHGRIPGALSGPSAAQLAVLPELWRYLAGRYGMTAPDLRGHFDYGKPSCPGDLAELWVRQTRGDAFELMDHEDTKPDARAPSPGKLRLSGWLERERALWLVGYLPEIPDGQYDLKTRGAIERFQAVARILIDGAWGPQTDAAMHQALTEIGRDTPAAFHDQVAVPVLWDGPA